MFHLGTAGIGALLGTADKDKVRDSLGSWFKENQTSEGGDVTKRVGVGKGLFAKEPFSPGFGGAQEYWIGKVGRWRL